MKVKLPESARERKRSFGGATASTLLHVALIGGTIVATGVHEELARTPPLPEDIVYVRPHEPRRPEPPAPPERPRVEIPTNVDPVLTPNVTPPDLTTIPDGLPPTTATIGTIGEDEFRVTPRDSVGAPVGPPVDGNVTFTEHTVEKAVQSRSGNPTPRYPSMLAAAGVEGTVYAQFVVDTAGRVEPQSIVFTRTDHTLFDRAVREVLLRSRYVAAEAGNRRVRQLVEQAFAFALKR